MMDVEANGDLNMGKKKLPARTGKFSSPGSFIHEVLQPAHGQCPKASAAKDTLDTGIIGEGGVVPKLQAIEFSISLSNDERATEDAKAAAVAAKAAALNASTKLDECLGTESGFQATVARLTNEKANLTSAKNAECERSDSLQEYEFEMPANTHHLHICNFSSSTVDHCWETAYKAALEELERDVQGQLDLYGASFGRCGLLTGDLGLKEGELRDAEGDRDDQKLECGRKEQHKTTMYCHLSDKI